MYESLCQSNDRDTPRSLGPQDRAPLMPQALTIRSLARAFELVKGMQAAHGLEWGEDYSKLSRDAIAAILPHQGRSIDEHLDRIILSRQRSCSAPGGNR
jgi:hypothetical protein